MQSNTCALLAILIVSMSVPVTSVAAGDERVGAFLDGERNLSPFALLFAVEPPVPDATRGWQFDVRTASHAVVDTRGDSSLLFDGETTVASVGYSRQVSPRFAIAAELPYVWHGGGELDGFIDDWHSWFGFPDGIRDDVPRGQLRYTLRQDDVDVFDVRRGTRGIGDIRLRGEFALGDAGEGRWSLALGVKLPTGDAGKLTGSGALDASMMLNWRHDTARDARWSFDAGIGGAWLGDASLPLDDQRNMTWTARAGGAYRVSDRLTLGARLQAHGGLLDNAPAAVADPSLLLITGGSYDLAGHWQLRITVGEDVRVDSAPDVTFRLGLARRAR